MRRRGIHRSENLMLLGPVHQPIPLPALVQRIEVRIFPKLSIGIELDQVWGHVRRAHEIDAQGLDAVIHMVPHQLRGPVKGRKSAIIPLVAVCVLTDQILRSVGTPTR